MAPLTLADDSVIKTPYTDVKADHPNQVFITYLYHRGILTGFTDGTFQPDDGITRAEAAVVMVKAAGLQMPSTVTNSFKDVPDTYWAARPIAAATQAGYLKGFPDGTFRPDTKLTRAQGVSLIMRLCTQNERADLPDLKDMSKGHWAAGDMGTAIALEMIGTSANGECVYPEGDMSRSVLARALAILLTTDPGLNQAALVGRISDIKGEISLTRSNRTEVITSDSQLIKGDVIQTGKDSTANVSYPDGSSTLIEENTQLIVKESTGRNYIKQDGTPAIAIEFLDLDVKEGTLYGALAAKRGEEESAEATQTSSTPTRLLASQAGLKQLAAAEAGSAQPWYKTAQKKKVKVQVDMPWGIAAIRGTFFKVTVNQDGSCKVSCLTGSADVRTSRGSVPLGANQSSLITGQGAAPNAADNMGQDEVEGFNQQQQWVVETALQMDINQEAPVLQMIVDVSGNQAEENPAENAATALDVILDALKASGIQLSPDVAEQLERQLEQLPVNPYSDENIQDKLDNSQQSNSNDNNVSTGSDSRVEVIEYDQPGTYGPANGSSILSVNNVIVNATGIALQNMEVQGSVTINCSDCSLENLTIKGNLILGEGIAEGDVTLTNTCVNGTTAIRGGGSASIHLVDSQLSTVFVYKIGNTVHIVAEGDTSVGALTLNSGAILEESGLTGSGFSSIVTTQRVTAGSAIILSGSFDTLEINVPGLNITIESGSIQTLNISSAASNTKLTLCSGASIQTLNADASAEINGSGRVVNAVINAAGVIMEQIPFNWTIKSGITADLGGQVISGTGAASNACDVLTVNFPAGATVGFEDISAEVAYEITEQIVDVTISTNATWIMYSDINCTTEISDKTISLIPGANYAYIKVIAQDNATYRIYTVTVVRHHSSDCSAASVGTAYTVDDTGNTIAANTVIINTNSTVNTFLGNLTKHEEASWKVVTSTTSINTSTEFDAAAAKAGTATLIFGDKLAVKAGDGTIKVYTITVVLGDPVLGCSGGCGAYDSNTYKTPRAAFTWGLYRYYVFDSYQNMWWIGIIAYDSAGTKCGEWQKGAYPSRYHTGVTLDNVNKTVTVTVEQGSAITFNQSDVKINQP